MFSNKNLFSNWKDVSLYVALIIILVLILCVIAPYFIPVGAIIVLAVMILPSIISVSMTALEAVPREYEDASLALGATATETWFRVSVPAARSGIAAAVVFSLLAALLVRPKEKR